MRISTTVIAALVALTLFPTYCGHAESQPPRTHVMAHGVGRPTPFVRSGVETSRGANIPSRLSNDILAMPPAQLFPDLQSPEKYRPVIMLKARDEYEKEQGIQFDKILRGNKTKKMIALTFDDGPHAVFTLKLLNILKATHTPATFFLVGKQVDKFPTLVQLELLEGHEIGNHTYDHVELTQIPPQLIGFELDECDRAIKRATGALPRFFRPPGGDYDDNVIKEASRRKYIIALWTDDPADYAKPGADVVLQRCLDHLDNGAVILLHDGIPETISILPALIAEARKRGYEFVTMSELADNAKGMPQNKFHPKIKEN
jgi:peptidoglycan/xylan/chitin deacetylase (PgdA/CDA1 family)